MDRIRRLAVPPAWTDVWIAPDADSHVQATGRDARGRKQYRYHADHTSSRSSAKFEELASFAEVLGKLRRRVNRDLKSGPRTRVDHDQAVAVIVRLLDLTGLRIGNVEYSRDNKSYGLTTLRQRHVSLRGQVTSLRFRGKSRHEFDVAVEDAMLARLVRRLQHLPGQALFQYQLPDDERRSVTSTDVNAYLHEHAGEGVTAKTFRTWKATVITADELARRVRDRNRRCTAGWSRDGS